MEIQITIIKVRKRIYGEKCMYKSCFPKNMEIFPFSSSIAPRDILDLLPYIFTILVNFDGFFILLILSVLYIIYICGNRDWWNPMSDKPIVRQRAEMELVKLGVPLAFLSRLTANVVCDVYYLSISKLLAKGAIDKLPISVPRC